MRLRRHVLQRIRHHDSHRRQRLHLRLRHHGRTARLDHRLGSRARIRGRRGHRLGELVEVSGPAARDTSASRFPAALTKSPFEGGIVNLPAIFIICVISIILIIGISESARFNGFIVALKVTIVVLVIGLGLAYINRANYVPFIPPNTGEFGHFGWSGVMRAAGMIFFAYIGFDAVSTAAQETKNPQRDMPIGIIGSLGDLHGALCASSRMC